MNSQPLRQRAYARQPLTFGQLARNNLQHNLLHQLIVQRHFRILAEEYLHPFRRFYSESFLLRSHHV